MKTWEESKQYILNPFFKDGEMNQGIGRFAFLKPGPGGEGISARDCHRHTSGIFARTLGFFLSNLRSGDPDFAADLSLGLAATGVGHLQAVGAGRHLHHRHLRHVADGDQHSGGSAKYQPRIPQCRTGA